MRLTNLLLTLAFCTTTTTLCAQENFQKGDHFLYCHMSDRGEWTAYALSPDGIHYHDLLGGEPIFDTNELARIEGGTRDAFICRKHDGSGYIMVTTDMRVEKSHHWFNYGIDLLTSDDLIHWKSTTFDFRKGAEIFSDPQSPDTYKDYSTIRRVWAPQILWNADYTWPDGKKGGYFIYYSLLNDKNGEDKYDRMYYSYADESFTTLTKPRLMFDWGYATIDADINYLKTDGMYHMMIKKEGGQKGIFTTASKTLEGGYPQPVSDDYVNFEGNKNCEGVSAFQIPGEKGWRIAYIEYSSNPKHYRICQANEYMREFRNPHDIEGVEAPQHGSFMRITKEEYDRLQAWSDSLEAANPGKYYKENKLNPVFKGYHADPEVLYSNKTGKFYIYPTTDGQLGWHSHDFHVFSSADMKNWKDEGVMFDLQKDCSWADWYAWAPCAIEVKWNKKAGKVITDKETKAFDKAIAKKNTKKYDYRYFYYFVANKQIGVASSDTPEGPFTDALGKPLLDKNPQGEGGQVIDPDVFQDPATGKYYLYWGNGFLAVSELASDMQSIVPGSTKVLIHHRDNHKYHYNEGVYVFYRDGKYYFTWSENDTRSVNYRVRCFVSESPTELKAVNSDNRIPIILSADGRNQIWGTGHHSVIQHPKTGEWHIVYHRFVRHESVKKGFDAGFFREVCIDKMEFDKDGNVIPVKPSL
ncbi:MAG: family 43 glycosylhydrolase [Prevotella sp.]|nr:family 43 glycosylhydrolase [Prevotella sp.]